MPVLFKISPKIKSIFGKFTKLFFTIGSKLSKIRIKVIQNLLKIFPQITTQNFTKYPEKFQNSYKFFLNLTPSTPASTGERRWFRSNGRLR